MGWKRTVRSISAASNQANKTAERSMKATQKEKDRLEKKMEKFEDAKEKVRLALTNEYASGKIDEEEYKKLTLRIEQVPDEVLVFGKTPGITLAKRFAAGKIDEEEFKRISTEMIPKDFIIEKETIFSETRNLQEQFITFRAKCGEISKVCSLCSKPQGLFKPLTVIDEVSLCGGCLKEYKKISTYKGFSGTYLTCEPAEIKESMNLPISIQSEWL